MLKTRTKCRQSAISFRRSDDRLELMFGRRRRRHLLMAGAVPAFHRALKRQSRGQDDGPSYATVWQDDYEERKSKITVVHGLLELRSPASRTDVQVRDQTGIETNTLVSTSLWRSKFSSRSVSRLQYWSWSLFSPNSLVSFNINGLPQFSSAQFISVSAMWRDLYAFTDRTTTKNGNRK